MTTTTTALQALLSLVRREAPHLSGKVLGDAEEALRAALSAPAAQDAPSERVIGELDWESPAGVKHRIKIVDTARASQPAQAAAQDAPAPAPVDWRHAAAQFLRDRAKERENLGWANRVNELEGAADLLDQLAMASPYGLDCAGPPAVTVPAGMALVPDYRGYARLGVGAYLLNHSSEGNPAELIISIASEEEAAGRTVGDLKDNPPGTVLQPEQMAVRLRFENVAGLDALERQLRLLRDVHFPDSATPAAHPVAVTADDLIDIARRVEGLKRECGKDPESPIAIQNGRYMAISYALRDLAKRAAPTAPQAPALVPLTDRLAGLLNDWLVSFADCLEGGEAEEIVVFTRQALAEHAASKIGGA